MSKPAVEAQGLRKAFGEVQALDGLSLAVPAGSVLGLLGPNGSGKTHRPEVLFLDEPTTGLDPESRFALWDSVRDLARSGTTVLLTTQYLEEADALADQVVIISAGRVTGTGTPAELKARFGTVVLTERSQQWPSN